MPMHDLTSILQQPERRRFLQGAVGVAGAAALAGSGWFVARHGRNLFELRREQTLMATTVTIACFDADVEHAGLAMDGAFRRMAGAAAELTRFDPASPVSRLNRDGYVIDPPAHFRRVLARSFAVSAHTDGDFDVSVMPLLAFFESLPQPARLDARGRETVRREREHLIGYRHIVLDERGVRFARPGMSITLDGLAKGYVIDQGIAALQAAGIENALIDAGGDLRAISGRAFPRAWRVGVIDPTDVERIAAVITIRNAALGTSGNYRIFYSSDKSLFHVIDPHTGYSPLNYSSITAMAETSIEADAMSVAAASMPLARLREVMQAQGNEWLVFDRGGHKSWRSRALPETRGNAEVA